MAQYTGADYEKNLSRLATLTPEQVWEQHQISLQSIARFKGTMDELESALGFLQLGHHVGWRVLLLVHNKRTIRKYEEILEIDVRKVFPEEGPSAERSLGYSIVKKLGNFWKAVSGELKSDELKESRRTLE